MTEDLITEMTQGLKISAKCERNEKELGNLIKENDKLKAVFAEQQKFLSTIDTDRRKGNVIITGVPEQTPLTSGEHPDTNDREKVEKIIGVIGCAEIPFSNLERLGQEGDKRVEETNQGCTR